MGMTVKHGLAKTRFLARLCYVKEGLNVFSQTQGPHDKHQEHKSQSSTSEPALSSLTRSDNLSSLKNKPNIVELCETIPLKVPQKASRHYNQSQSFQTQVLKAKMYLLGQKQWKQLPEWGGNSKRKWDLQPWVLPKIFNIV